MSNIIKPTVGRKVWYRPSKHDVVGLVPMVMSGPVDYPSIAQPLDATIIAVWGDRMINVLVTDVMGRQFPVLHVDLLQEGDEPGCDKDGNIVGRYCEWMPYQKGQAEKQESSQGVTSQSSVNGKLYASIKEAMDKLGEIPESASPAVNAAFNTLRNAFWLETPAPADAAPERAVRVCKCDPHEACYSQYSQSPCMRFTGDLKGL